MEIVPNLHPRALLAEEKLELDEAKKRLARREEFLEYWSKRLADASTGSLEEQNALRERRHSKSERDRARLELDQLKVEFGQSTLVEKGT